MSKNLWTALSSSLARLLPPPKTPLQLAQAEYLLSQKHLLAAKTRMEYQGAKLAEVALTVSMLEAHLGRLRRDIEQGEATGPVPYPSANPALPHVGPEHWPGATPKAAHLHPVQPRYRDHN